MKILRLKVVLCLLFCSVNLFYAQTSNNNYWRYTQPNTNRSIGNRYLGEMPKDYKMVSLNFSEFENELMTEFNSKTQEPNENYFSITIPTPEGSFSDFYILENSVISPEVKNLYTIKTFKGFSKESPHIKIRCDFSEVGFHAFVYNGKKSYYIEPYYKDDNSTYIVYFKKEVSGKPIKCGFKESQHRMNNKNLNIDFREPNNLRTFRLAYVASGEYSQEFGGNPYSATNVLNSFASALNLVNPIYERDLGITFTLVSTEALVFEDPDTDPFDVYGDQGALIAQNQIECDNGIGNENYDVGHLLVWANTGGLASGGVVCYDPQKGEGFSGNNTSFVTLIVDYSCHEIGHQFGAEHNFVSQECGTSADGFRFEPGEGSSIMSYAGVCGPPASYQDYSDQFFHSASIITMNNYVADYGGCETTSTPGSGNSDDPVANAMADITIPMETPFILVGDGTDPNDPASQLSYLWEQYDGNGAEAAGSPDCASTDQPLFRYREPVYDKFRVFPEMIEIMNGNNNGADWEKLPCVARDINFNLIVRDNNTNWGRTGNDQMLVTVANTGPFAVISPNGGETWSEGSTQTVSWSENGTSAHCADVDILLSTDDGNTFTVVASAVPNNGSHDITVPNGTSTEARVLIQCSVGGNFGTASTFFDVSDAVFTIETNSTIIYTDIPDGVPTGIDFNNDGTMEFDISENSNPGDYITYDGTTDNNIHAVGTQATQDWDVPDCVDAGFTIDASNQWEGQGDCSLDAWGNGNSTITYNQDEYICVRFNLGGTDIYYGWIRFTMDNSGVITYKDYAYNSLPGTSIEAGQTSSGLAVGLLSFQVRKVSGGVRLEWSTASELNNKGFEIQRSDDGKNWTKLTFKDGVGNSLDINNYSFIDKNPLYGINFYRLKQIDLEGAVQYSKVISVFYKEKENGDIKIYPNPTNSNIHIVGIKSGSYTISDITGKILFNGKLESYNQIVDISKLFRGVYIIRLMSENKTTIMKIIKE